MDCNESMTSTGGLEVKATINNDLPWKMVAKGSRSSTRRTKKQVARSAAPDVEAEGDTGSEKLGVSVLGQHHLAERVDHVPIKKRRFMVPAPSALNVSSQRRAEVNHALPVSRLNPNLMGGKTPKVSGDDKPVCGHDFSGIEILAEVACSSGMSSEIASVGVSQVVEPVRQQDALTFSGHVEGNDSSTGTVDVSGKDTTTESGEKGGEDKSGIIAPQNASGANQSEGHTIVASSSMIVAQNTSVAVSNESSTERPKENMEAGDSGNLAPQSVTVSENISGEECTGKGKNSESLTNDRLHWDLNLPTDAWGQSCDVVDETSRRYSDGEVTESVTERTHVDGSKDYATSLIASDVHMSSPLSSGHKAEASTQNGKEFQSGYDSQFEDGELREPYPWEEIEGDSGDVEQLDYGSEPENERFYSVTECNENKLEDVEKGVVAQTKCGAAKCESGNVHEENNDVEKHVVVCMNDSHSKGSSPSRSFGSKPFREPPSHEPIRSRRPYSHEDMSERDAGPNKFAGRERTEMRMQNRSPRRGQFSRWDSDHRFSPSIYKRDEYGLGRPPPKTVEEGRVRMSGFDQPGPDPRPQGYVRRHFSNGGYRGRFRRFPDGSGNRDFRGVDCSYPPPSDANGYPSRIHNNRINSRRERSNSPPVFRRLHDPQSRSRPRSRSPVSWNGQNRSPPGFRADDNRMERVRLPFQKRFPVDQEMGFMSPQRSQRNSRFFDSRNKDGGGENHHNNFRGRKSPPGRMFRQEQRFDNNMRRVNSENNNNFRPFVRQHNNNNNRRFDDGGSRGEGCRYEKNENMYEMGHRRPPPRGLETVEEDDGGNIRRFRLDAEQLDTVVSNDNKNNNSDAPFNK